MNRHHHRVQLYFALGLLVSVMYNVSSVSTAKAGIFAVSNPAQLAAALLTAQSNGQNDTIRIAQGNYIGNFIYTSHEPNSLVIQGGWTSDFSTRIDKPENTVLDGNKTGTVLVISCDREIQLTIEGITVQNGLVRQQHGGGIYINNYLNELIEPNTTTVRNCIVKNNSSGNAEAGRDGGGIYIWASTRVVIVNNTIFGNNTSSYNEWHTRGGGIFVDTTKELTIQGNLIYENQAVNGGGIWVDADYKQVVIRGNTIINNRATEYDGGGLYGHIYGPTIITDNIISNNSAARRGGGIFLYAYDDQFILVNNVLAGNTAGQSGAGLCAWVFYKTILNMTNNTIVSNQAGSHGGGVELLLNEDTAIANLYNNIIWNNGSMNPGRDLYIENDGDTNYLGSICNLYNNDFSRSGWGTRMTIPFSIPPGNLDNIDPQFVQPTAGDYRLGSGSPCMNAGSNLAPNLPATDINGDARIQQKVVDIGAYEGANTRNMQKAIPSVQLLLLKNTAP